MEIFGPLLLAVLAVVICFVIWYSIMDSEFAGIVKAVFCFILALGSLIAAFSIGWLLLFGAAFWVAVGIYLLKNPN